MDEFAPAVDARLQERFDTKLLGLWPFGPQVLFCKPEIASLADIEGYKVRTYDQNLANFVSSLGATPVPLGFADVHQSLARGVVDCAITGPSSANSAAWPEVTTHVLPIAVQIAVQGYGMNLDVWNSFDADEQASIQGAFDKLTAEIWDYSEELFDDAMRCNVGETPCELNEPYELTEVVAVSEADIGARAGRGQGALLPLLGRALRQEQSRVFLGLVGNGGHALRHRVGTTTWSASPA